MQNPHGTTLRKDAIWSELEKAYLAANESPPSNFEGIVETWEYYLRDIPLNMLNHFIKAAALNNHKFKVPTPAQAMTEFRKEKPKGTGMFEKTVHEAMVRRLQNPELFPPEMIKDAEEYLEAKGA